MAVNSLRRLYIYFVIYAVAQVRRVHREAR
jgi:hypothetical protein